MKKHCEHHLSHLEEAHTLRPTHVINMENPGGFWKAVVAHVHLM